MPTNVESILVFTFAQLVAPFTSRRNVLLKSIKGKRSRETKNKRKEAQRIWTSKGRKKGSSDGERDGFCSF